MATHFLTIVIGWYMLITALLVLIRRAHMQVIFTEITKNSALFFIVALITVILGLIMVTSHNIWASGWPLVITLFSWLVLVGGIARLFFPEIAFKIQRSLFSNPTHMYVLGLVVLLIGLIFLYQAYFGK